MRSRQGNIMLLVNSCVSINIESKKLYNNYNYFYIFRKHQLCRIKEDKREFLQYNFLGSQKPNSTVESTVEGNVGTKFE